MPDDPNKKILIIDDEVEIRKLTVTAFQLAGYEVEECPEGESGLKAILGGGYAAILLDLKMPLKDGLSVLKGLETQKPLKPNGPIVVLSSVTYPYAQEEAIRRGAAAFINKTEVSPTEIVKQVESLMQA